MMQIVCNWYHAEIRILGQLEGEGISHRLCPECAEKLRAEKDALLATRIQPVRIDTRASA